MSGSWIQGPGALQRSSYTLDPNWELVPSDRLENLKLHL